MPDGAGTRVAGVDGCKAGWVAVIRNLDDPAELKLIVVPTFVDIVGFTPHLAIIAVDMPIGLPDRIGPGGRGPEKAARKHLGMRQSSVFTVPSRAAVYEDEYLKACATALATSEPPKKVSKQCFFLFPKIREIDALMTPELETRVHEAKGLPGEFLDQRPPRGCGRDDLLDAAANSLIAERIFSGTAEPFPKDFQRDERGLRMAIWA